MLPFWANDSAGRISFPAAEDAEDYICRTNISSFDRLYVVSVKIASQINSGDKSIPSLPALLRLVFDRKVLEGHGGHGDHGRRGIKTPIKKETCTLNGTTFLAEKCIVLDTTLT